MRWVEIGYATACSVLLVFAVWFGGTSLGWFGDRVVQICAAVLLALIALRMGFGGRHREALPLQPLWLATILLAIPILAWLGMGMPTSGSSAGALQLRADLAAAGVDSVAKSIAAEQAIWFILPAVALLLGASRLEARGRTFLLVVCVGLAFGESLLAMSQLRQQPLGFVHYEWRDNVGVRLGTFGNRNHLAALLLSMLPVCVAHAASPGDSVRPLKLMLGRVAWGAAGLILFSGIVASQSRSVLILALLATLVAFALVLRKAVRKNALLLLLVVAGLWLAIGGWRMIEQTVARMTDPAVSDGRLSYLANSIPLLKEFGAGGIGLGNFQRLYGAHQGDAGLAPMEVNHVHNDWVELMVETGWVGVLALLALTVVFARRGLQLWTQRRAGSVSSEWTTAAGAWVGMAAIALHSMVDFPLRTTAMTCVFALLAAIVFAGAGAGAEAADASTRKRDSARRPRGHQAGERPMWERTA